jgi:glycosyltransferase involved in cell wall biosynthesis
MNLPKISIVTVVWNDKEGLEKTIKSVINQTYNNIEFIIIDGASTDGTFDSIKQHESNINYYVSEKDNGIYDAMNKGIKASSGTWINFMNAGDTFIDKNILQQINFQEYNEKVLIYGNKIQDNKIIYPLNIKRLEMGEIMACHQSMFFNKDILTNELYYDLQYKIYGDYELVNRIYLKFPKNIQYFNKTIAIFKGGGISSIPTFQKRKDKYMILYSHYKMMGLFKGIIYRILKKNGK